MVVDFVRCSSLVLLLKFRSMWICFSFGFLVILKIRWLFVEWLCMMVMRMILFEEKFFLCSVKEVGVVQVG